MQTRWLILAGILVLSGCVAPQKLQKVRTDISTYSEQRHQRATVERCADAGAMPGTTAELECRMGLGGTASQPPLLDTDGHLYSIREVANDESFPTLRWTRSCQPGQQEPFDHVTLRDVIARLSDYEPARTITSAALAVHHDSRRLSTHRLRGELERVSTSPIVLNRGLREAVQRKVTRGDLSMSQIAMRCGRIKQDRRGNRSGETSWLARRIGQLREGGKAGPSPWVHTDVLALIVRDGLGASPREVEL